MLRIKSLSITLGEFSVRDVSLEIQPGEYFIILGPTGAGKTVLLETIAGIHTPDTGGIFLNDREITSTEPRSRNIGMVYQDYMLFPHITVEENIAFGLRQKKIPPCEQHAIVEDMCTLLELHHLSGRYPGSLSGGEQQRVALARALVLKPEILLLDEPMSALDGRTRERMRRELSRIRKLTGTTIIQITHHFEDVFALANRITIMREGEIVQVGETSEVFLHSRGRGSHPACRRRDPVGGTICFQRPQLPSGNGVRDYPLWEYSPGYSRCRVPTHGTSHPGKLPGSAS